MESEKKRRASKPKVKTGCRTCKIRRVKCDEGRPACKRCVSTGRVCDGYGVWSEGRKTTHGGNSGAPRVFQSLLSSYNAPVPIPHAACAEQKCVEWFVHCTISKIGGVFSSQFWGRTVVQALSQEPAVRHAVMALASTHRYRAQRSDKGTTMASQLSEHEKFTLQHYNKAIGCLHAEIRRHSQRPQSVIVALITCMVFVTLELMRGQYRTSYAHLQHGLKLVKDIQKLSGTSKTGKIMIRTSSQTDEDDVIEAFSRLGVHYALLGHGTKYSNLDYDIQPRHLPYKFESTEQARQYLDVLLARAQCLVELARHIETGMCVATRGYEQYLESQWRLEKDLEIWLDVYRSSLDGFSTQDWIKNTLSTRLLGMYHTMALIMATSCTPWDDETAFDLQTDRFISIIREAIDMCQALRTAYPDFPTSGSLNCPLGMAFTMDIGFIQPLYYTAIKCRIPQIRRHAIGLLRLAPHREGIWNGALTARIAEEVVTYEEWNIDASFTVGKSLDLLSLPEAGSSITILPSLCRISDVHVELPDENTGEATVTFWQREDGRSWKVDERKFQTEDP
ncbi:hypothetical protein AtubIFM55763_003885 [Aspergillus tubingensis]|uniref:C6 zinc finger domain protein n=1 Tax=Aspergillus niger TaxID=5061 RepID=A0A100IM80_ASPNG|nr:C6 zinc finger domain protein [Aspergillus tubingensis]GAQ43779.1 C6 zinc finger domain protein [Aspergillus niger]GFN21201.1 C6 zinc finger domain protein [Aspergillus tubingensis]GLA66679.1 hypothetical protein AtubIFM54640_009263 [Aspergillus tubingensis]GLA72990.1 hypothetical protein AtubIFM55763_003885 [Aspergillus tubingensis]